MGNKRFISFLHDPTDETMMIKKLATIFVALVAVEHLWILVLEMFLWETPYALKTFGMTPEQAATSATLAANQGLYNGFLAAGLIWQGKGAPRG